MEQITQFSSNNQHLARLMFYMCWDIVKDWLDKALCVSSHLEWNSLLLLKVKKRHSPIDLEQCLKKTSFTSKDQNIFKTNVLFVSLNGSNNTMQGWHTFAVSRDAASRLQWPGFNPDSRCCLCRGFTFSLCPDGFASMCSVFPPQPRMCSWFGFITHSVQVNGRIRGELMGI